MQERNQKEIGLTKISHDPTWNSQFQIKHLFIVVGAGEAYNDGCVEVGSQDAAQVVRSGLHNWGLALGVEGKVGNSPGVLEFKPKLPVCVH